MKVHLFESAPWVKAAWKACGTRLAAVWLHGLLTPATALDHARAEIVCTDASLLNAAVLEPMKRLKLIALRSTGIDQVDLAYCRSRGIVVCNVPAYARHAVAEHVFALLLAIGRRLVEATRRTRRLDFSWVGLQGFELNGKVLAVIGTGAIGKRVAAIAVGFGMAVLAFDRFPDEAWAASTRVRYMPLNAVLSRADVVTLHVPGTPETRPLITEERLALMKTGVVLINTARGDVVDACALLQALKSGRVAAAGLDVLPEENDLMDASARLSSLRREDAGVRKQLANHLLLQHPNVLVTPHCAFFTREAAEGLVKVTVDNIEAYLAGDPVNRVA